MKKYLLPLLMFSFILFSVRSTAKNDVRQTEKQRYVPGVVIVKLKPQNISGEQMNAGSARATLQSVYRLGNSQKTFATVGLAKKIGVEELERVYTFQVDGATDVEALAKQLEQNPMIEWAEPNYIFKMDVVPNDPNYSQVYPLGIVKADTAWGVQKGDTSVVIAIIDSGVDWDHPDLASVIWTNWDENPTNGIDDDGNGFIDDIRGWDFVTGVTTAAAGEDANTPDNNPMDFNGHGTHCAGIAAGATNNGVGIASLGWGCRVMPLRIGWHDADGNGYGTSTAMSQAFIYAANNGASVASLSYGTSEASVEGARYAHKNGVVVINSAGNSNTDFAGLLGTHPWALSVGATNSNDAKASYSSFNALVDISAPGGDFSSGNFQGFLSTVVNPSSLYGGKLYEYFQGTSMATPLVAALAGLIKSQNKNLTPTEVIFKILGTADNIESKLAAAHKGKMGAGRINALRALTENPAAPGPKLNFVSYTINDSTGGNANGILEPGENAKLIVTIRNEWGDALNVNGTLATSHWTTNVTKSTSGYGTIPGISNLDGWQKSNVNDVFQISIGANAVPSIIPFTLNYTATGGYTKQFTLNIPIAPQILLVDDDDGTVNVESFYGNALQTLGASYEIWNHSQKGTPSAAVLSQYNIVIWFCEWTFPSLDSADRSSITSYLNGGGKLFLSGQDLGWDLADAAGTEFVASAGASKTFFENMLKAKFLTDDAASSSIVGVAGDSIGAGLAFSRYQVFRASTEQYPDAIDPFGGSVSSVNYSGGPQSGKSGGIRYSGAYKLVYFGFGGIETITDSTNRVVVMDRVLKWLGGYNTVVDKLKDSENTTNPFAVNATVTAGSAIQSVELYYDNDGTFPFNKTSMTLNAGKYSGNIPAQSPNSTVDYFVLVKTAGGYLPYNLNRFYVGADVVKPVFGAVDTIRNSIKFSGPYPVSVNVTDNIAMDTAGVVLKYSINGGAEQSVPLAFVSGTMFSGQITPSSALSSGDVVSYYVNASDAAAVKNITRYPIAGSKTFVIGREFIDNFEKVDSARWNFNGWGYSGTIKRGLFSITDSPVGSYSPNTEKSLVLANGYDLSSYTKATLQYYRRSVVHSSDTVYVEITRNNTDWATLKKITGIGFAMTVENVSIDSYTGVGNSNVKIRFRLKSDGANESDGFYADDIELLVNSLAMSVKIKNGTVPTEFSLSQNYPNPFNPSTSVRYAVPQAEFVSVKVYDNIGREVATLAQGAHDAGYYETTFDASTLASGIYFCKITAGTFTGIKKMMLLK